MTKNEAFSGLEAAIVLIAFVVVAAVFSYVMLGAGFFATQKSQEVTYSGVKQSTSNVVLDGQLYGSDSSGAASSVLELVEFNIGVPEGGQAQNLKELEFVITSSVNPTPESLKWATSHAASHVRFYEQDGSEIDSYILKAGDKAMTRIDMPNDLSGGDTFTIEMKPLTGAATLISKSLSTGYSGGLII